VYACLSPGMHETSSLAPSRFSDGQVGMPDKRRSASRIRGLVKFRGVLGKMLGVARAKRPQPWLPKIFSCESLYVNTIRALVSFPTFHWSTDRSLAFARNTDRNPCGQIHAGVRSSHLCSSQDLPAHPRGVPEGGSKMPIIKEFTIRLEDQPGTLTTIRISGTGRA
jgi:hypothetical protein